MEGNTRNPYSYECGDDGEHRQSIYPFTASAEQFAQGALRNSRSVYGSSEQNMPVTNLPAAETKPTSQQQSDGQHQPADISSADSHFAQITATEDRRARKRERDRVYRGRVKEKKQRIEAENGQLKAENGQLKAENGQLKTEKESLKEQLDLVKQELHQELNKQLEKRKGMKSKMKTLGAENKSWKQRLEAQSSEMEKQEEKIAKLRDNEQQMKSKLKASEAENALSKCEKESLKEEIVLVNQKFETQSKEMDELRNKYEELNQEFINQLVAENGRLKDEKIESPKVRNEAEQGQQSSKLENLEKEPASTKQSNAESNTSYYVGGKDTRNRQPGLLSYRNR